MQSRCYCCNEIITAAKTAVEHIIPNALGGKLKNPSLLCSVCNNKLGREVDAPFAKQMGFVVNRLGIQREKGGPPPIKARFVGTGDPVHLSSDGTAFAPRTRITKVGGGFTVECHQRNLRRAQKTLKRRVPNVHFTQVEPVEYDAEFRLETDFGGEACYRAITKMALNYFLHLGGSSNSLHEAISFIKSGGQNAFVLLYYPTWDVLPQRATNQLAHVLAIKGDPIQKLLCGYVELFSAFRFLVKLSDSYDGDYVSDSYCFDLRHRREVKTEVRLYQSRSTIADIVASADHIEAFKKHIQGLFLGDLKIGIS
jgi:hypothetical protein